MKFWRKIESRLVPEWRAWWRLWSMRLAAVAAGLATWLVAIPDALNQALGALPRDVRDSLPAWIGPAVFAALFLARFWDQRKGGRDG